MLPLLAICGCGLAVAEDKCDEFISIRKPGSSCRVVIDLMSAGSVEPPASAMKDEVTPQYRVRVPVQSDVMIRAGGTATAVLQHASPFLACTIAATPGIVTRDLSTAVAAALTTAGALVLPFTPPALAAPPPAFTLGALQASGQRFSPAQKKNSRASTTSDRIWTNVRTNLQPSLKPLQAWETR